MPNPKDLVGAKKAPVALVPSSAIIAISEAMANGAAKYGPFNWRDQPVQVVTYVEAALRHLYAYLDGQDAAEDTGISHLAHAGAGLAILIDALEGGSYEDNRVAGPAAGALRRQDKTAKANIALELRKVEPVPVVPLPSCGCPSWGHYGSCQKYVAPLDPVSARPHDIKTCPTCIAFAPPAERSPEFEKAYRALWGPEGGTYVAPDPNPYWYYGSMIGKKATFHGMLLDEWKAYGSDLPGDCALCGFCPPAHALDCAFYVG